MAAPRVPLDDRRPAGTAGRPRRTTSASVATSKPRSVSARRAARGTGPGTAGGGRTARRRWRSRRTAWLAVVDVGRGQPRHDPLAGEPVGIAGRLGLERDRRRQPGVVERRRRSSARRRARPGTAGACPDPAPPTCHGARIVCVTPSSASSRSVSRSTAVSGSQTPGRPPPEPELEVAQAPADLGPPVGGGRQRQDRVVERLGQAVAARDRRRRSRDRRPDRRPRASRRASARGPTRSARGCRARRWAGSSRRRSGCSSRGPARPSGRAGRARSPGRSATAGRSGRGRRARRPASRLESPGPGPRGRRRSRPSTDQPRTRRRGRAATTAAARCPGRRARSRSRSSRSSRPAPTTPSAGLGDRRRRSRSRCSRCPGRARSTAAARPRASCAVALAADLPPGRRVAAAAEHRRRPFEAEPRVDRRRRPTFSRSIARSERRVAPVAAERESLGDPDRGAGPARRDRRVAARRRAGPGQAPRCRRRRRPHRRAPRPGARPAVGASRRAAGTGPARTDARGGRRRSCSASPGSFTRTTSWIEAGPPSAVVTAAPCARRRLVPAERLVVGLRPPTQDGGHRVADRAGCPRRRSRRPRRGRR